MYFFEAIQYPFNSKGWINKAAVAGIMLIIPLVNIFAIIMLGGYIMRLVREISDGNMELPEFDYGADFGRGLTVILYSLVYYIPMLIVSFLLGIVLGLLLGKNAQGVASILGSLVGLVFGVVLMVAWVRYALTDDTGVFMQVSRNIAIVRDNIGPIISYFINSFVYGIIAGIILVIGFLLCVIPGMIMLPMIYFGSAYLMARFAQDLNLSEGKSKNFA
jgi:hypothetical protein